MVSTPTPSASGSAPSDQDSPWKEALERFFPEFLALLFPAIHAEIDWHVPYRSLDSELQQITGDADSGRRYADKLLLDDPPARRTGSGLSPTTLCLRGATAYALCHHG